MTRTESPLAEFGLVLLLGATMLTFGLALHVAAWWGGLRLR